MAKKSKKIKRVRLKLVGLDGNAFALMGAFTEQARREGWAEEEIKAVCDEATAGDYDHLLATLASHCENGGLGSGDDDEESY